MTPDKIIVLISGIAGMGFIAWFFFGKREAEVNTFKVGVINIRVSGGYNPSTIALKKGQQVMLRFYRTDPSSCLEEVVIPDFKIRKFLPLKEKVEINFKADKPGEFPFSCGMNMFHGKIIIR